jgi:glycosyltransferase involved in cell wall biosynthesis
MTEAFAKLGLDVTLYHLPSRKYREGAREYYGVEAPVNFERLPRGILPSVKRFRADRIRELPGVAHACSWSLLVGLIVRREQPWFALAREPVVAWGLTRWGVRTVLELHDMPGQLDAGRLRHLARDPRVVLLVAVTECLRQDLIGLGLPPEKMCTLHDGADVDRFLTPSTKGGLRTQLGLPSGPTAVYTGSLHPNRGVEVLLDAAPLIEEVHVLIVGVPKDRFSVLSDLLAARRVSNVILRQRISPRDVPLYLSAADFAVLPEVGDVHTARYASPLKLFEYMAAGLPIIASDLPAVREVLKDGETGLLVAPRSPVALAHGIRRLLCDPQLARSLGERARAKARDCSWRARASVILSRVKKTEARELHGCPRGLRL